MLNPFIVGRWDGNHAWLQWEPTEADEYALQLRYFKTGASEWTRWIKTMFPWPYRRPWVKIPTHHDGWRVQAAVAPWLPPAWSEPTAVVESKGKPLRGPERRAIREAGIQDLAWETAQAAEFQRSSALFEFASTKKVTLPPDSTFIAMVDGAAASYHLERGLELPGDRAVQARMEAVQSSGLNQLDHAEHFRFDDATLGVTIINLEPSANDLRPLGGDDVLIKSMAIDGPFTLALGKINRATT